MECMKPGSMAYDFLELDNYHFEKKRNVHYGILTDDNEYELSIIDPDYIYFHYGHN